MTALLAFASISIPVAVLLVGPSDGLLHRLLQRQELRTWHYETLVVMAVVAVVVIASGGAAVEWCGWAALVCTHGQRSVSLRMAEAQQSADHHIECHRWSRHYLYLAETFWAVYFVAHRSWAALCGVAVFVGYARWRTWYSRRKQ